MKKMIDESELKVLEILWCEGDTTAKDLKAKLEVSMAWSDTATLQMIRNCISKGLIERSGTMCHALVTREQVEESQPEISLGRQFNGSSDLLLSSLLDASKMTVSPQIDLIRNMVHAFVEECFVEKT